MSQRKSGYDRQERDLYQTPEWVTESLIKHIPDRVGTIWEPAAGEGYMADALKYCFNVWQSDIYPYTNVDMEQDFLGFIRAPEEVSAIVTNPPYRQAKEFIELSLILTTPMKGIVAMLLRTDYDHAKTRRHLFEDCPAFSKKVILRKRITWFVEEDGKPKSNPSTNHCWFIWDHNHQGPPTLAYEA